MRLGSDSHRNSIGEILDELLKSNSRNKHINESNIIVSTPVFDHIVYSMKTKTTAEFKEKELQKQEARAPKKGVGHGAGSTQEERKPAPGGGRGWGVPHPSSKSLWLSLGRPRVVESTTLSQQWLQLQLSQLKLLENVPTLQMGEDGAKQARKKLPSIPLRKKVSTGGVKKPHCYKPGTVAL